MLDERRVAPQPDTQREQLFIDRYETLLAWAMHLTKQREAAEDLVQDAFVQFVGASGRLEDIENIEGYLRNMLRYMNMSRLSSAQHLCEIALPSADNEYHQLGETTIEIPRRMQASEELHQICLYACIRKESSRAGSVLILRFLHDYLPTEIAAILNSSRHSVDEWQRLARREAKLFIHNRRRLRFLNSTNSSEHQKIRRVKSDEDFMVELRQMIFSFCHGECLSRQELQEIYARPKPNALTRSKLAHIVSCAICLNAVNTLLSLPPRGTLSRSAALSGHHLKLPQSWTSTSHTCSIKQKPEDGAIVDRRAKQ